MTMEKDLDKYLKILNSDRCLKKPKEAVIVLEKISNCFTHGSSQFTIGLLIGLVLNKNHGIFTFIWKVFAQSESLSSVTAAFKLLDRLITSFQNYIEPYFSILYEKCVYLLDAKFAKVKEVSLKLIKKIIDADLKHSLDLSKLVMKLEKLLKEKTEVPTTVVEQIYSVFGFLFDKYPESVRNEKWLFLNMLECLKHESSAVKNPSLGKVKGAFEGINGYFVSYSPPEVENLKEIYEFIKKWSKFKEDRKAASKAGLNILQNHWRHFSSFIYNDREFWKINLDIWINQKNTDQQMAFKVLCSFYSVIALFVKQKSDASEASNYIIEFTKCLESNGNLYERKAALVGIKLFILTGSLTTKNFNKMCELVFNFMKKEENRKNFTYLPLCIECVSAFVLKSTNECFSLEQLTFLQRLSVKLIETYPSFDKEFQPNAHIALEKSFYIMGLSNAETAHNHIEKVLYQGLIRTCSSLTSAELELLIEIGQNSNSVSYKSFLSLWKYLLTLSNTTNLPVGGSFSVKKGVATKVIDVFVSSFLKIISKLNFSVDLEMEVEKPSDLHLFINLVDLYQDLVPLIDFNHLQKWLVEILTTVIHLSRRNPLVSGFYQIAAANLNATHSFSFFDDSNNCFELVTKFLEDILTKVDHYKGDLQLSCLKVLLAAPTSLIQGLAEKIVPALELTVQLSRSCFPMLKDLIEALERWDLHLPSTESEIIMKKILPYFDVFFQSPYFRGKNYVDSSKGGKKLKVDVVFSDSELLSLQKRFLMLLGNLEIKKGLHMIELPDTELRWKISDKHLVYSLPCNKRWVELCLDEMLLRVVDLTESCGDRKTRLIACELLYSMAMVVVGNINQLSGGYTYLFRKVVKTCLMLGCDSDGLICQIFEPLMYQIVHYFSGKQALHFSETDDLVDILMDCVSIPYNPTARDFSGTLLREFTVWSIKQLTPEELKVTPESVKRILQRIYSFALHPSYSKRLGAAVVFNRIYSVLREEDFVLNAYWFQLFYYFMESLRMCEEREDVTEIIEAIHHVERPLVELRKKFNEDSTDRVVPAEFEGRRLCHLVKWTMERACDEKPNTRRTAMKLVQELAPLVENCDSNMLFASKQLQSFFKLKENSLETDFIEWLKYQTAGFEYCTWLLEQSVLTTEEVFQPKFKAVLKRFINVTIFHKETSTAINEEKQQAVLSFLLLLDALKERVSVFSKAHWDFLKTAVFRPSKFGFDLKEPTRSEQLLSVLTSLLGHFSRHLTEYNWEYFYQNLESVITAPVFGHIVENKHVSVGNLEFLFALKVIESSGMWSLFQRKIFFSVKEDLLVVLIFKCLFLRRGQYIYAACLEPSCQRYLEDVLRIILNFSVDLKGLMKCLENDEEVREEETEKTVKKGECFQLMFGRAIFDFLKSKHELLLDWVLKQKNIAGVKLLIQVLENRGSSNLSLEIFLRWQDFENLSLSSPKILLHLAVSGARVAGTPGFLKTSLVADKIYAILENRKFQHMDFSEIEMIFNLFPYLSLFGEGPNDNDKLRVCLSKIQIDLNDLKESGQQNHVQLALEGILQSLKTTASLVVLDFITCKAGWFNAVCRKYDVESALQVFANSRTPVEHATTAVDLVYRNCFERDDPDSSSLLVYKLFLGPLMKMVPNQCLYHLVNEKLKHLSGLVSTYWGENETVTEIMSNMAKKISAAGVFQTFITKLPKEELDQIPKEKRQMIDATIKKVFNFLKKPYPPKVLKERYRKLMCEIFNMICCTVCARCVDEKFYKLFIFDDRGSFLFESVDRTVTYNLEMDFEEIPKRKKHLTILREAITEESRSSLGDSMKYIQTNTLFTSSLQEEVTRFDLSLSFIRPLNSIPGTTKQMEIELEMDSINGHECMATLVATISKMVKDKITPLDDVVEIPCWLKFFISVLKNSDHCENLRLFVLKAIYNVQEFVAPFYRLIFSDFLDSILKLFINFPINYFLMDLIEMMVGWKYVPQDERTQLQLTKLVEMILDKSDSFRREIVKYNLEILKVMIEMWKNGMYLSQLSRNVFKRLAKSLEEDIASGRSDSVTYLNVHACGIVLSNGIPAWEDEDQFFQLILMGFRESKHCQLFGEVCGQALHLIEQTKPGRLHKYETLVRDKISTEPECWLQLLYGVHKHHPKISSHFTFRIFSSAWDSMDSLTVKKLEMLLSHVSGSETAEDTTFDRHVGAFLLDMLNSPDFGVQELSLQIGEKLLHKLDDEKLKVVMKEVKRLQRSTQPCVRKWVYEIGKKLYKISAVSAECKIILLKGLNDGVNEFEKSCLDFWRELLNLTSPDITLLEILRKMYTSETEDIFLSNAIRILLQLTDDDYLSKRELFSHPIIHRSKFRKRNLILGTRQSFLLSLSSNGRSLTNQSLENVATIRHRNLSYLRPTSTLTFQPTVCYSGESLARITDSDQNNPVPRNPFKQRFYKSEAKTSFSFSKRKQNARKEHEAEKKEEEVEIIGEYRDGDYPDIQIKHSQIAKLLEALAKRDHHFARLFLVSFYSGLVKAVNTKERQDLLSETSYSFEHMLTTSGNFDPGVFGFVLQVILNHVENLCVNYQSISNAAVSSNWIPLGALILERIITDQEEEPEPAKKRRGIAQPEEKRWLELARLYRSLEEFDVLSGIFLDKLNVTCEAKEAIRCESIGDWAGASKQYEWVLRSDPDSNQMEFYTESYLSCLSKLSSWSVLNKCIRATVNNDLSELWNNYYLLTWFLKSEMMEALGTGRRKFQEVVEEFCKSTAKQDILEANFGEEMAVFDWFSDNLQKSSYRIDKLCLDFLAGWSHLDRWSYNLRASKLASLQTLSELNFAIKNLAEVSKSQLEQNIQTGVKRWEKNSPAAQDDLTIWDVKLGYRREFLKRLNDNDLEAIDVRVNLALAKAALSQENLNLTKECLSRVKEKLPEGDFDLKTEHQIFFNAGKMLVAKQKTKDPNVGIEVYLKVWNGISKQISNAMETETSNTLLYSCNFTLGQLVSEILPFVKNQTVSPAIIKILSNRLSTSEEDVASALQKKGLDYFETAIDALGGCSTGTRSNAYLEISKFLLKFPTDFDKPCKYLLKSMSLGNLDARQLFGCVLNMSHLPETSLVDVISESDQVPSWMFLMWINQILSRLSSKLFPLLESLSIRITQDYPNAIRYTLKLLEEVKRPNPKTKSLLLRLCEIVSKDRLYDDFWNSLKYLAPPDLILSHHLEDALEEANRSEPDYEEIKDIFCHLQKLMFSVEFAKFRGPVFKIWEKFKEPLEDLLAVSKDVDVLKRKIKNILISVQSEKMSSKTESVLLESYSPWLHDFHAHKEASSLELPGQYDGVVQPIKKYLIMVSSFRNDVLLFDTKCRPMRIGVLGNDAKEHRFLVKFGEDLRQDERIQQVFHHFNHQLRESRQTSRFSVDTYKVIPLTSCLGMIEWVEDNVSLYEMLEASLGDDADAIAKAQSDHLAFLSQGSPLAVPGSHQGTIAAHLVAYETIKRENAVANFKATAQSFRRDLLKKSFLDLSTSPEHFMHLRANFATSHAITCITHWLVGIGDRHLQNTLVSTKSGRVLGIDFGYAFGFATQFLIPPELLPFRLSPQILNFLQPLEESGWIKQTMIHCLRAFRKDSFRLRAVLEVFAEEPVMNWLKQAKKNPNYQSDQDTWYPREKIGVVDRKLSGANPVAVFEADLRAGHSKSKYLEKFLEVLRGEQQDNIRARLCEDGLTEEEQVECLIDLATDPHVLAKTYIGWNPWL